MKTLKVNLEVSFETDEYFTIADALQTLNECVETLRGYGSVSGEAVIPKETRIKI